MPESPLPLAAQFSRPGWCLLACLFVVMFSGCQGPDFGSSPIRTQQIEGTLMLGQRPFFAPCNSTERWYLTTDSTRAAPGRSIHPSSSQLPSPYSTRQDSNYYMSDTLPPPEPASTVPASAATLTHFPTDSIPDSLRSGRKPIHVRFQGYATERSRFGPIGVYDRLAIVQSIKAAPQDTCSTFSWLPTCSLDHLCRSL